MEFLIETASTPAGFLAVAALSALLAFWLAPAIEKTSYSFTLAEIRDGQKLRRIARTESALLEVRNTKRPNPELRPDWQLVALDGTAFEFELMLVTVVWADNGEEYYRYRLAQSPFKWDIEGIVFQSRHKINFA